MEKRSESKTLNLGRARRNQTGLGVVEAWGGGQQADGAEGHELATGGREGEARAGRAQRGQLEADAVRG